MALKNTSISGCHGGRHNQSNCHSSQTIEVQFFQIKSDAKSALMKIKTKVLAAQ